MSSGYFWLAVWAPASQLPIGGSSAADSCRTGEAGLQFAARHHAGERLTGRRVHHVWRQRKRRNVLLVIHDPSDLGRIEAVFVGKDAPGPHPRGDRIGAHADFVAFKIFRHLDSRIGPHHEAAVMEQPHEEDRQRNEGRSARPRDHVSRGRYFADVELEIAHHAAVSADDRHDLDKVRVHSLDGDSAVLERLRVTVRTDRDIEFYEFRHCRTSFNAV